jgi:K+-transporting ATPase KdpF subunit
MDFMAFVSLIVSIGLFVYLCLALFDAEKL